MSTDRRAVYIPLIVLALSLLIPVTSSDWSQADSYLAQDDDVKISASVNSLKIVSGQSSTFYIDAKNMLDKDLVVYIDVDSLPNGIDVQFPNGKRVAVEAGKINYCEITINAADDLEPGNRGLSFTIYINDPERGYPIKSTASNLITVDIINVSKDEYANKFFMLFDNHLPSVFGSPIFAALVTLIGYLSVAYIICFFIVPRIEKRVKEWKL